MAHDERRRGNRWVFSVFAAVSFLLICFVLAVSPTWARPAKDAKIDESMHHGMSHDDHDDDEKHEDPQPVTITATVTAAPITTSIMVTVTPSAAPTSVLEHNKTSPYLKARVGSHWHGWSNVTELIVFGDSYTDVGFNMTAPVPSKDHPLNEEYNGWRFSNGPNWVDYLTYTYNESTINTLDMAKGGATIDRELIRPDAPIQALKGLRFQIEQEWEHYNWTWTADTSLFAMWFGVNDIIWATNKTKANYGQEFVEYADLVDQLYQRGGRNFLILNVPPMDRSPQGQLSSVDNEDWPQVVAEWNANVTRLTQNFSSAYTDATMLAFDVWKVYDDIMAKPCTFEESCGFVSTFTFCIYYAFNTPTVDFKDPRCPYSVDKYLWLNAFHPGTQMHNATARAVHDALTQVKPLGVS